MACPKYDYIFRTCVELIHYQHCWQFRSIFHQPDEIGKEFTRTFIAWPIYPWCFFARAIASRRRAVRPERFRLSVIHRRIFGQSFSRKGTE